MNIRLRVVLGFVWKLRFPGLRHLCILKSREVPKGHLTHVRVSYEKWSSLSQAIQELFMEKGLSRGHEA